MEAFLSTEASLVEFGLLRLISGHSKFALLRAITFAILLFAPGLLWAGVPARGWELDNPTPLMSAALAGDVRKVNQLLDKGRNVNERLDKSFATPLVFASSAGQVAVIKALLARGANPNLCSWGNVCPIWWAVHSGSYESTRILIEAGAKLNSNPSVDALELSVLQEAVSSGNQKLSGLLLANGADVEYTNFFAENTPLAIAVKSGYTNIAKMLIDHGADITQAVEVPYSEAKYFHGQSALELARAAGYRHTVEVVEMAARTSRQRGKLLSVTAIIERLYRDPAYDLSSQGQSLIQFLRMQSPETIRRIRNTVFARKNYQFEDGSLQEYFRIKFSTYHPTTRNVTLSDIDKRNVDLLRKIERYRSARDAAG